jgi:hypothetical protein
MDTVLLTTGLACVIAAIVGGGLKAFGMELPILRSLPRQVLLGAVRIALIAWGSLPIHTMKEERDKVPPVPVTHEPTPSSPSPEGGTQRPNTQRGATYAGCDPARTQLRNPEYVKEQFELLAIGAHGSDWELAALTDATIRENLCGPLVARGYTPERVYTMSLNDLRASAIQHELIP